MSEEVCTSKQGNAIPLTMYVEQDEMGGSEEIIQAHQQEGEQFPLLTLMSPL